MSGIIGGKTPVRFWAEIGVLGSDWPEKVENEDGLLLLLTGTSSSTSVSLLIMWDVSEDIVSYMHSRE